MAAACTPHSGGTTIAEVSRTTAEPSGSDLRLAFTEEDKGSEGGELGKLISEVSKKIIEEDNKCYGILLVSEIEEEVRPLMCCKRRSGGKNTFCLNLNCEINHRTDNYPSIKLKDTDILVVKSPEIAFISPIGSEKHAHSDLLE